MKVHVIVAALLAASTAGCASRCMPDRCCPVAPPCGSGVAVARGEIARFVTPLAPLAPPPAPAPAPAAAPSPQDMEKMFAEMMKLAEPGPEHAGLKTWVGEWAMKGKFTGPDGKVEESDSTSSITNILGDRFIRQEVHGTMMGMPFEGRGVLGYDNFKKKFVGVWIDSMGTGIMTSVGEETEKGKVWTFTGSYDTPMGMMTSREVMRRISDDEMHFQMEMSIAGKPTGSMSLSYRRK